MALLNEAWRTLGDPARRAVYDAALRTQSVPSSRPSTAAPDCDAVEREGPRPQPAAFPWRGLLFFGSLAVVAVVVASLFAGSSAERTPDNLIGPGSCVTIEPNGDAREVRCSERHDGTVAQLVPFGASCPYPGEPHRDRQGMGIACVTMTTADG